jgi:hypothetical protein
MRFHTARTLVLTAVLMILVWSPAFLPALRAQGAPPGFPDLVAGLKATPGCLGVETARTASGKQVIFAWFDNKTAALAWYHSEMHQQVKHQFAPNAPAREPMAGVPDDGTPIMAIASLTMTPPAGPAPGATPSVSQIAIELYRPLPGGIAAGGRFAPATLRVPGMIDAPMAAPEGPRPQR